MRMKILAAASIALSCGLAMTIVSCNGDGVADAPDQPARGGKAPQFQANGCESILKIDRCVIGSVSTSYDQFTGVLSVTNSNALTSGIKSTFSEAHDWHQQLKSTDAPPAGAQLSAVAYDGVTRQARLDMAPDASNPGQATFLPTFDAGDGIFKIEVYNDGALVGSQGHVPPGGPPIYGRWRLQFTERWGFLIVTLVDIMQRNKGAQMNAGTTAGACAWVVGSSADDASDFTLPDGQVIQGDEIRFIEEVDGSGRYPYHSVNRVEVLTNIGSFDIISEHARN